MLPSPALSLPLTELTYILFAYTFIEFCKFVRAFEKEAEPFPFHTITLFVLVGSSLGISYFPYKVRAESLLLILNTELPFVKVND
jgi:hypothetical protein